MDRAELVALYCGHALPRPQRELRADSHWAQRVVQRCGTRAEPCQVTPAAAASSPSPGLKISTENRKRPLIVFDGASTKTVIKVRRVSTEEGGTNPPATEGNVLKNQAPSPAQVSPGLRESSNGASLPTSPSCTISPAATARFSGDTVISVKVKRALSVHSEHEEKLLGSPEVKSKIQRIEWP